MIDGDYINAREYAREFSSQIILMSHRASYSAFQKTKSEAPRILNDVGA